MVNKSQPGWAADLLATLPPTLDLKKTGEVLGCSSKTVRRRIRSRELSAIKHGQKIVIPRRAIVDFLLAKGA